MVIEKVIEKISIGDLVYENQNQTGNIWAGATRVSQLFQPIVHAQNTQNQLEFIARRVLWCNVETHQ